MNRPNRRRIVVFAAAALLLSSALSSCGPAALLLARLRGDEAELSASADSHGGAVAGELVWVDGTVTLNGDPVTIGDPVAHGDVLVTGAGGAAEVSFGDYRVLRAADGARLVIDAEDREFRLDGGSLAVLQSKTRRIFGEDDWTIRTPTTVAAVRGTIYHTRVESADSTYFCLCNGRIHLEDEARYVDLEAAHHTAVRAVRTDQGVEYRTAGMEYHTDESMEALADRVHVPIDWTRIPE